MERLVGVLSDAHGNEGAFRVGLEKLRQKGASEFIFLGDAIGYIPSLGVLEELEDLGGTVTCLMGNHEEMLLSLQQSSPDHIYQLGRVKDCLSEQKIAEIRSWPKSISRAYQGFSALFMHGRPEDPVAGYLYEDSPIETESWAEDILFVGNTHRPFIRSLGEKLIVNVGSCGLPRDHGHLGSAALLDTAQQVVTIFRFDISAELERALLVNQPVHPEVHALSWRRPEYLWGEMC